MLLLCRMFPRKMSGAPSMKSTWSSWGSSASSCLEPSLVPSPHLRYTVFEFNCFQTDPLLTSISAESLRLNPSFQLRPLLSFFFQSSSLISNATATALLSLGAIEYCLHVLKSLLEFWKSQQGEEEPVAASQLLRPHTASSPPDMSPFFLRQYVKVADQRKWLYLIMFESWLWQLCLYFILGTCCGCVWSLLSAFDWNGAQAALSNQEDCWHQPTYSTSCLWPFLVLLSLWSEHEFIITTVFCFTFSACIDKSASM